MIQPKTGRFVRIDLTGQTFGKLTVLGFHMKMSNGGSSWLCQCECGNKLSMWGEVLKRQPGACCKECRREVLRAIRTVHGGKYTHEYRVWSSMKSRCTNPNVPSYQDYGARGISVCKQWMDSFETFIKDMGKRPDGSYTIERMNNSGNYEPGNCKWGTKTEQANNRRSNKTITLNGQTQSIAQWARQLKMDKTTIRKRLLKGWPPDRCLSQSDFRS